MNALYRMLLEEIVGYPSVSTDSQFQESIFNTANALKRIFEKEGFNVECIEGYGNPVVIARYTVDPALPTCLIYGHYDVQPATKEDGWLSDPFLVTEREGRLYARGAVDNKGQFLIHVASVISLIRTQKLKYNITFFIEGDEETGSPLLSQMVSDYQYRLACDFVLVSDGEICTDNPVMELSFRGVFNATLGVRTSDRDLHSGLYGGTAPNAAHELSILIAKLYDADHRIAVAGFEEGTTVVTEEILNMINSVPFSLEEHQRIMGTKAVIGQPDVHPLVQIGFLPTIQVTGITSGYTGEGYRNSVPATAQAKLNARLSPSQSPEVIARTLEQFFKSEAPNYCEVTFDYQEGAQGILLESGHEIANRSALVLEDVFGKPVVTKYCGAIIPIVIDFARILKVPQLLIPLGNEDCNMHAANENISLECVEKGLAFSSRFFSGD